DVALPENRQAQQQGHQLLPGIQRHRLLLLRDHPQLPRVPVLDVCVPAGQRSHRRMADAGRPRVRRRRCGRCVGSVTAAAEVPSSADSLLARRKRLLGPAYSLFYKEPLHIVRGEGAWLYDAGNRRYLDMYNNVPHVGHCHPRVVEAIARQSSLLNTHTRYLHESVLDYAERLTGTLPDGLDVAMFSCTGTEANELALRIARAVTGGTGVIVTDYSYHGNSQAISDISTEYARDVLPPHVVPVPAPDTYRGRYRGNDAAERYVDHVAQGMETLRSRGIRPAALVLDTIISSEGVVELPPGYLSRAAGHARNAGALFIADEVQPGLGRTGERF